MKKKIDELNESDISNEVVKMLNEVGDFELSKLMKMDVDAIANFKEEANNLYKKYKINDVQKRLKNIKNIEDAKREYGKLSNEEKTTAKVAGVAAIAGAVAVTTGVVALIKVIPKKKK